MALVAAIRPKSRGSSTIGMKKSVVAMTQVPSSSCQTAASSAVSVPTRSCGNGSAGAWSASSWRRTDGASLQPQPPPWARLVRRGLGASMVVLVVARLLPLDDATPIEPGLRVAAVQRVSGLVHEMRHVGLGQRIGAFGHQYAADRD